MAQPSFAFLEEFLADPQRPKGTLRYHELQGFLFTVASSPELVPIQDWLPIVFNDHDAGYSSTDEHDRVVGALIRLHTEVNASVHDERTTLPADCPIAPTGLDNIGETSSLGQWARGFVAGHQWLEEIWETYVPEEAEDEDATMLMVLSFFSSKELAEAFASEAKDNDLSGMADAMREILPEAVAEYARVGRSIRKILAEKANPPEPRRTTKIGRNEPCPCGSGRKYKKCCGAPAA